MIVNEALEVVESPEKLPESNDGAFLNDSNINLRVFDNAILF